VLSGWLSRAWQAFRIWRQTRPFWGGLLIICGAGEILTSEHGPLQTAIQIGAKGLAGYIVPVMLLLCGTLLWFNLADRTFNSLLAMVLALFSWITSNLGGFLIGMLLGLVGGALALAWSTGPERQALKWPRANLQLRPQSRGLALILKPTAVLPPSAAADTTAQEQRRLQVKRLEIGQYHVRVQPTDPDRTP